MNINKNTQDALNRHLPLVIVINYGQIELRAVTQLCETGRERTRLLCTGDLMKIMRYCLEIFDRGGAINIDDLPWIDMNIWAYGWTDQLGLMRDDLRELWRMRKPAQQPEW